MVQTDGAERGGVAVGAEEEPEQDADDEEQKEKETEEEKEDEEAAEEEALPESTAGLWTAGQDVL